MASNFLTAATIFLFFCFFLFSSAHSNARFDRICKNRQLQVLSDVDDTLKASGTNFVAGIDTRWPGGSLYAGLGAFYLELSRGPTETTTPLTPGIVSARPEQLATAFPDVEEEFLNAAKETPGISTEWVKIRVVLPGHLDDNLHLHSEKRYRDYAETKVNNVKTFAQNNPDKCIIFMGDNGQGDQLAGRQMLEDLPDQVLAIFIHNVTSNPPIVVPDHENIYLFNTYLDAASIAYSKGYLAKGSVLRVLKGALKSSQYEACKACYPQSGEQTASQKVECLLSSVEPLFDQEGGGCSDLFSSLEKVAKETSFTGLSLPQRVKRVINNVVEEAQAGFFALLFYWLLWKLFNVILIVGLAVLILVLIYRYHETKAKSS